MNSILYKRLIAVSLFICIIISVFAACGKTEGMTPADADNTVSDENLAAETTEETILKANLPDDFDLGGMEIRIMMYPVGGTDWQDWASRDIYSEAENGEPINDAVYARNLATEERLNCKILGIEKDSQQDLIKKQALAGSDDYHISTCRMEGLKTIVQDGYLVNLHSLEYMDLSKPWYDRDMVDNATILGQLYYVTGDMIILDDDSTSAMVFSKSMVSDFNMDSPYLLVNDSKWTFDKMDEMITVASEDLNGDGVIDLEDQYGLIWQRDAIVSYLHAAGGRIVTMNDKQRPELTLDTEHNQIVMQRIFDIMYRDDIVINLHHYEGKMDIYQLQTKMFSENRVLMMWIRMRVVETLRNMENDFGIIPMPKFDEAQSQYHHTVNRYTGCSVCIPNSAGFDHQLIGAVIEQMSAEARYTVREAYYDVYLGTKLVRDPESTDMLDIIMNNRVFDCGELYDIAGLSWNMYLLTMKNTGDFASFLAKHEKVTTKSMDKFISKFEAMADDQGIAY
jgi:hypothetical protein